METASHLVTGGCGQQGTHIVQKLRAQFPSARVSVLSRNPNTNLIAGVTYHACDITKPEDVARVFEEAQPTVVYHCAGVMTVGRVIQTDEAVLRINLEGTRNVLEESKKLGVKAFVFTSSASVVQREEGGFKDIHGGDETMQTISEEDEGMVYSIAKASAERLVLAADDPSGMRTCSLRPAAIYGEYDNDIIPGFMRALRAGRHRSQVGDGSNLMSTTYAGNSADAHLLAAAKLLQSPDGVAGEAFFITNGDPVTRFWEFARAVWRAAGDDTKPEEIRIVSVWLALTVAWISEWIAWARGTKPGLARNGVKFSVMTRWFDISKARERLGYEPKVEWEEGVRRGVKWFLENEKKEEAKSKAD